MTTFFKNRQTMLNTAGYTIDQTILIVAIIAILVTLIIISVGWQLINKTSGTKLASQFKQIEDANGLFYSTFRVWPDESYSAPAASASANMLALAGTGVTYRATVPAAQQRNFVSGFRINGTTNIQHNFGSGGAVTMQRDTNPFSLQGTMFVIQFDGVPFSEAVTAEEAVDVGANGTADYATGRITAVTSGNCVTGTAGTPATSATPPGVLVNVCYAANLTQ